MTLPENYRKLVAVKPGDTLQDSCEIQEVPLQMPHPGDILVRTHYSGVNASDYLMAIGQYISRTEYPLKLGSESVGEVVAVGDGVEDFKTGDYVLSLGDGGYTEYFTTKARYAIPVPVASPEMISVAVSGLTAIMALNITGNMSAGETVFVTAAAGGTGSMAVQIAKLAGCTVIGTCGNDDKVAYLESLGCDRPINYRKEDVKEVLKSEYPDGVDIVFECVGGEMFDLAVKALAVHGRLIVIGAISEYESGPQSITAPRIGYALMRKSASVRAFWLMNFFRQAGEYAGQLMQLVTEGKLKLSVDDSSFKGIEGTFDALRHMYDGKNIGKVVVDFTG